MAAASNNCLGDYLRVGTESIPYLLRFAPCIKLKITVYPDASVHVEAPEGRSVEEVRGKLRRRARWIIKQREYFGSFQPRPISKTFQSGETFVYLGRHYRLKATAGRQSRVLLNGRFLCVTVNGARPNTKAVRKGVVDWYTARAKDIFQRRLDLCHARINPRKPSSPNMIIRPMARRWGSYTKAGNIVLNRELIQAPIHCIDYVICHELVHAVAPNHGPRFYELLARHVPDWEHRKAQLESAMAQLPSGITTYK